MKTFYRFSFFCIIFFFAAFFGAARNAAVAQQLDPARVKIAIDQGVRFLKVRQAQWEAGFGGHSGGRTALCVLALVSSGVAKNDPAITRAADYLRTLEPTETYVVALQTMVFCLLDPQRDAARIQKNVDWFARAQNAEGGWSYGTARNFGSGDNSNAQFAVLALYEAERAGFPAPNEVWEKAQGYWERGQNDDGSWGYSPGSRGSSGTRGSMVCAGIGSLLMASGQTSRRGAHVEGERIICASGKNDATQERLEQGLQWLARNFSVQANPQHGGSYYFYYMYGLERVGRLTGQRFLTRAADRRGAAGVSYDWYREGTHALLDRLEKSSSDHWSGSGEDDVLATAFALLFLSKGRWPVLLSKIEYGNDDSWNSHPNDISHLTRFAEQRWKLDLTWQTMRLDAASVEDLLQSPVLYWCGSKSPLPRDENALKRDAAKMREYLDQGGFLFAEALTNDTSFDTGFRAFLKEVFTDAGDYELQLLPPEHPIWTAELPLAPEQHRHLWGINSGCRTCVVYAPVAEDDAAKKRPSLSCLWEVVRFHQRGKNPYPPSVNAQIDGGLTLGINVLAYATQRELKTKDEKLADTQLTHLRAAENRRGRIYLGLLAHGGGAQVAPRAFSNLLQWISTKMGMSVDVGVDELVAEGENLSRYPILLMHGRNAFSFSEAQRKTLQEHLERGGTLIAASICSSAAFTKSFREEMKLIFPEKTLVQLQSDDDLFSNAYGGNAIDKLALRVPEVTPERGRQIVERETPPQVFGLQFDDRWGVLFVPDDISCALERGTAMDCRGYTSESAIKLGVNLILYALGK